MDSFFTFKWEKLVGCSGSDLRGSVPDPVAYIQYMCVQLHSRVQLFATLWTVAHQAPLSIFQARILEWVAISSSRGSSWPRDGTCVSCMAGGFFTTVLKPDP